MVQTNHQEEPAPRRSNWPFQTHPRPVLTSSPSGRAVGTPKPRKLTTFLFPKSLSGGVKFSETTGLRASASAPGSRPTVSRDRASRGRAVKSSRPGPWRTAAQASSLEPRGVTEGQRAFDFFRALTGRRRQGPAGRPLGVSDAQGQRRHRTPRRWTPGERQAGEGRCGSNLRLSCQSFELISANDGSPLRRALSSSE